MDALVAPVTTAAAVVVVLTVLGLCFGIYRCARERRWALALLFILNAALLVAAWWRVGLGEDVPPLLLTVGALLATPVMCLAAYLLRARIPVVSYAAAAVPLVTGAWWLAGRPAADVFIQFFVTLPPMFVALWNFAGSFTGVLLMGGSIALVVLFCLLAFRMRNTQGWLAGLFGGMAVLLGLWWLIGIVPSAWIYFLDTQQELLQDQIIPGQIIIGRLEIATNFYQVFRDSIVLLEGAVVLGIGVVVMRQVQKRFPGGLAEGEERGPTTGGYK